MKCLAIPVVLAANFAVSGQTAPLPPWAAVNTAGHEVRIAVAPAEDTPYRHLSWPKAVWTDRGTVIVAYSAGIGHNRGGSGAAVSVSRDRGRNFSPPRMLIRFPEDDPRYRDCGNLALGLAGDGSVLLLAMAFNRDEANNIFGWRSIDEGKSWSAVDTSALGPNDAASVFGTMIPVPGRGLAVFGHYRQGSSPYTQGLWMSLSQDGGLSWQSAERIADVHAVEPVVVQSADRLIGFFRGDSQVLRGRQYVGVSDDHGATWETKLSDLEAEHPDQARLAAPFAVTNPNKPREILVLTTERAVPGNTPGRIWLWRGDSRQLNWKRERVLLEVPRVEGDSNTDFGYPWLLHLRDDRWQMYYYHGDSRGTCYIWATEVDL